MAKNVSDILVERLIDWGVDTIFGFPGDGVNGIFEALRTHQEKIRFIQVRHEEACRIRGSRLREIFRTARGVHRHIRSGRHPSVERTLRRKMRRGQPVRWRLPGTLSTT